MRKLALVIFLFVLPGTVSAQDYQAELDRIDELRFDDAQVQSLFSLFFSQAPYLLDESADTQRILKDLAPQAMQILRPEQRRLLLELAPQEELERFGTMSRQERKDFVFDAARGLVHPSKREWLERVEEMTR